MIVCCKHIRSVAKDALTDSIEFIIILGTAYFMLQVMSYKLRVKSYELRVTSYKLRVPRHDIQV